MGRYWKTKRETHRDGIYLSIAIERNLNLSGNNKLQPSPSPSPRSGPPVVRVPIETGNLEGPAITPPGRVRFRLPGFSHVMRSVAVLLPARHVTEVVWLELRLWLAYCGGPCLLAKLGTCLGWKKCVHRRMERADRHLSSNFLFCSIGVAVGLSIIPFLLQ
ncbi:hypothetical protein GE09DRAFT_1193084 [Coniochaeta sp. 2T2.1]|nr:hypothetical protein GE09DRAFT_1193084 [Coniochaeta sp. 2T2.1]